MDREKTVKDLAKRASVGRGCRAKDFWLYFEKLGDGRMAVETPVLPQVEGYPLDDALRALGFLPCEDGAWRAEISADSFTVARVAAGAARAITEEQGG